MSPMGGKRHKGIGMNRAKKKKSSPLVPAAEVISEGEESDTEPEPESEPEPDPEREPEPEPEPELEPEPTPTEASQPGSTVARSFSCDCCAERREWLNDT